MSMALTLSKSGEGIATLAGQYQASLEATIRRLLDVGTEPMAAVFFRWKLKPTQKKKGIGYKDQPLLFGGDPEEEARELMKLRVEYALMGGGYDPHIPIDKSVENAGVIYEASVRNICLDAEEELDLGPCRGRYRISAIPVFTQDCEMGPNGERSIVAIIRPLEKQMKRDERMLTLGV